MQNVMRAHAVGWTTILLLSLGGCGADGGADPSTTMTTNGVAGRGGTGVPNTSTGTTGNGTNTSATAGAATTGAGGARQTTGTTGAAPTNGTVGTTDASASPIDAGNDDMMEPFDGPVDGDPNKPMVEIEGVPCGVPSAGWGRTPPSVKITDRDVVVSYPCAHEGAAVTFFLFLHGTLQAGQKVPFTMSAFPIHEYVDSHNVIVVVPEAVGSQWGNGDNGADLPHLYEVVDWVYDTFGDKFDIRSMWASGGSWGAFYLNRTFACDPKFEGRLRGVRMVVGTGCPSCSDRLACIVAEQELEEGGGSPLSPEEQEMKSSSNIDPFASAHGCGPKQKMPDLGPVRHWTWPDCDPGFVHSYYLGPGQHADPWDDPASMDYMVEEIKSIE